MSSLARWCHAHRLVVVLLWLGLLVGLGAGVGVAGNDFSSSMSPSKTESSTATALLRQSAPAAAGTDGTVVWHTDGARVTDAAVEAKMTATLEKISRSAGVASVTGPYSADGAARISEDGRTAYATVNFGAEGKPEDSVLGPVERLAQEADGNGLDVELGGTAFARTPAASPVTEGAGIVVAAVILFLVFRSVRAAALPILTALAGVGTATVTVMLLSHVVTLPDTAISLGSLIGLGVGIDYALFIVNRHRNALMSGAGVAESVAKALNTSGRAVVFAGLTVVIALLGMYTLGLTILNGMALGASVTVGLTVLAAVTLLPALLGFMGHKVLSRKQRRLLAAHGPDTTAGTGFSGRWAALVQARPKAMALVGLVVMAAVVLPFASMRLGSSDAGNLPADSTNRQAYDLLADGFGPGFNGPLVLAAEAPTARDRAALTDLVGTLRTTDGVAQVSAAPMKEGQTVGVVRVVPTTSPQSKETSDLISHLRDEVIPKAETGTGLQVHVGGKTASDDDFASELLGKLPRFVAIIVLLGFLLLTLAFRSVLIPAIGALMNLLTIGAALGVITLVFQQGVGIAALGVGAAGPVEAFVPILVIGVMFGLSMDYQVFLVSRMREEWAHTGDNHRAVRVGQAETGRVVAVAAAIMLAVFGAFALGGMRIITEFGVGLAVAVVLDALVVRMVLVPALMHLCGKANWWLPRWLDRALPDVSVEGPPEPAPPAAAEPRLSYQEQPKAPAGF